MAFGTRSPPASAAHSKILRWLFTTIGVLSFVVWLAAARLGAVLDSSIPGRVLGLFAMVASIPAYAAGVLVERTLGESALLSGTDWWSALPLRLIPFLAADVLWNVVRQGPKLLSKSR